MALAPVAYLPPANGEPPSSRRSWRRRARWKCGGCFNARVDIQASPTTKPELPADDLAQRIRDFPVTRHGSLLAVGRITVDVVPTAMAQELASSLFQLPEEGLALHTSNSSGCRCAAAGAGGRSCVTIRS